MRHKTQLWKAIIPIFLGGLLLVPLQVWAENMLNNPGMEGDYIQYDTYRDEWKMQVANGWERFVIGEEERLRFFTSSDWAAFNRSPFVERRDGEQAQVWWTPRKNDTGIYQQVFSRTIGEHYGFQAGVLQVFETTNRTDPASGKLLRSVGIDPYGGTNPEASTVIWGPEEPHATYNVGDEKFTWFYPGVGATAMSTTVTVFVRVQFKEDAGPSESNQVWVDDTFMDIAPTTTLTVDVASATSLKAEWHGDPRPGFSLFAYEAQYRKAAADDWIDLQIFTVNTLPSQNASLTIPVETGVPYVVRARTWHEQIGGDAHEVPGPWMEQTATAGGVLTGVVNNNQGIPIAGAIVLADGGVISTTSGTDGQYSLNAGAGTFAITAQTEAGWQTLGPITQTLSVSTTSALTLTVYPPDRVLSNGGLEGDLLGWTQTLTATPNQHAFLAENQRSGSHSLIISGTGQLAQTQVVTDIYRPVLSFWYQLQGGDGDDSLVAHIWADSAQTLQLGQTILLPATAPLTLTQTTAGWQQASLPLVLSGTEIYSGNLTVQFMVNQVGLTPTQVYLDEVVLGRAWGGMKKLNLPVIFK